MSIYHKLREAYRLACEAAPDRTVELSVHCDQDPVRREDDDFMDRFLHWRGVDVACATCGGTGYRGYGDTSTWRGGIGGQALSTDVCDVCWGSGDAHRTWTDLRKLKAPRTVTREWLERWARQISLDTYQTIISSAPEDWGKGAEYDREAFRGVVRAMLADLGIKVEG